jgi:hypothetical protein
MYGTGATDMNDPAKKKQCKLYSGCYDKGKR